MKTADQNGQTLQVHLTNMSWEDAAYLQAVIAAFADPQNEALAKHIRQGLAMPRYRVLGGADFMKTHADN